MKKHWFKSKKNGPAPVSVTLSLSSRASGSFIRKIVYSVALTMLLMAVSHLFAENAPASFSEANKLYEQGRYAEAANAYEKILQPGLDSEAVYFNLGNAFLKAGKIGRAIFAYRTAEKNSPRDPDLRANLQFARDQAAGGLSNATLHWTNWTTRLALNEWTVIAAVAVSSWFLLLAFRQWRPKWHKSFSRILLLLGIVAAASVVCLVSAIRTEEAQSSVVIVPEAVVRRGPFEESQSAFSLRDGAEVTVLDQKTDWVQILDSSQRTGWLPQRQLLMVPTAKL